MLYLTIFFLSYRLAVASEASEFCHVCLGDVGMAHDKCKTCSKYIYTFSVEPLKVKKVMGSKRFVTVARTARTARSNKKYLVVVSGNAILN